MLVVSSLFWFLLAVVFACLEIEAEGKYGWAQNMPTWYRTRGFIPRLYRLAMAGKPLTGYHSFMFFLPVMVFHTPFFMGVEWTIAKEIMCEAMYLLWAPTWDYLWFVLNPAYGWKNFSRENVWWHAKDKWFLRLPLSYFVGWMMSIVLAAGASRLAGDHDLLMNHLTMVGMFILLTLMTISSSPLYHRWYKNMRQLDDSADRAEAGINHRLP